MDVDEADKVFPGLKAKLNAPKQMSAYAKEKQAAEAKKRAEAKSHAELLKSFQEDFGVDPSEDKREQNAPRSSHASRGRPWNAGPRDGYSRSSQEEEMSGGPSRKRRRALEEAQEMEAGRYGSSRHNERRGNYREPERYNSREREQQEVVSSKNLYLSSLPPSMTVERLKSMLTPHLVVGSIRFESASGHRGDRKKTISAVASLRSDTSDKQINDALHALKAQYVGSGLTMVASDRAPSSIAYARTGGLGDEQPFGAQRAPAFSSLKNAPPPQESGRFAPPDRYDRRGPPPRDSEVNVDRCLELPTTRAIHAIADHLLSQKDPGRALEIEALLMSLPEVQLDPRFAFLYDSKSPEGLYYRYCLWSEDAIKRDTTVPETTKMFEDVRMQWRLPTKRMPFPKLADLSYAVKDIDYDSDGEESDYEKANISSSDRGPLPEDQRISISPLQRARFAYLLARLPIVNTKLRRGDIARVTNFAISHAHEGIDTIVDMYLLNVDLPFSLCSAAKYGLEDTVSPHTVQTPEDDEEYDPANPLPSVDETQPASADVMDTEDAKVTEEVRGIDISNAKIVALYAISDLLQAINATDGVKDVWRYRTLFEKAFKAQKTFEHLAEADRQYGWGRMKSEQWKRKIFALLDIWRGVMALSADSIEMLKAPFIHDPKFGSTNATNMSEAQDDSIKKLPAWIRPTKVLDKTVDKAKKRPALLDPESNRILQNVKTNAGSRNDEDDIKPAVAAIRSRDSVQQEVPGDDAMQHGDKVASSGPLASSEAAEPVSEASVTPSQPASAVPKKRMRAEDMFAESDED